MNSETQLKGRDLDRYIAEHIVCWEVLPENCPTYSSKISSAWQIVEYLFPDGWDMELSLFADEAGRQSYRVDFRLIDDQEVCHTAFAESAPLAICYAAISTRGQAHD